MSSDVEICNVALTRVDRKRITALDDGSTSANDCNALFVPTRDALLRDHDWNFARARQKLAQLSTAPTYEFDHAYQLPTDWIATRAVHDNEDGIGQPVYRIEEQTILASADDIYLTYTKRITDASAMPPDFRSLFSYRLAEQLAKTNTVADRMEGRETRAMRKTKSSDAIEDDGAGLGAGTWVTSRGR